LAALAAPASTQALQPLIWLADARFLGEDFGLWVIFVRHSA
jgi:hypothetical protein